MKKKNKFNYETMKLKAKNFRFCNYYFNAKNKKIIFNYRIEFSNRNPLEFTEIIILPKAPKNTDKETLNKLLQSLHLILGISYYKLYCPSRIAMSFKLSQEQANFWNIVYKKGLGEFLYKNKINPKHLAEFPYSKIKSAPKNVKVYDRALLGIGGGKDSIVTAELLKNFNTTSFLVETQHKDLISERIINEIGNPCLKIQRILDSKIFEKHEGAYNGHIPISAIFAFLGILLAAIYKYKYVIVANEHSSNFGNLQYQGEIINHQWSKSIEFEALLQEYIRKFITPNIIYFSLLRQFYEIRIAQMFSKQKKYFPLFTSCNKNFTVFKERSHSLWCGKCPKCAFTFLIFAAFLNKKELFNIFQKNLFADKLLISLFQDLLGFGKLKPFDCVGTFEESQAALFLASKKFKNEIIIKTFLSKIKNPEKLIKQVFKISFAPTLPAPFRFLGIKNICILGYGNEGKISEKYIKINYPHLECGILDQSLDKNYLEKQENYNLAIKTPGISKTKLKIPYITATNIFFSQNKNFTIGITGSKGKSTTASLIYEILKTAGKKVRLIGNIGNPMLEVLLKKVDPNEIFVIELSSYMLDDIEYSPNIAVLLNLFPEHMNYHGKIENYYEAKNNIFKFQKSGDIAIQFPFKEKISFKKNEIPLLGAHNLNNIKAAIKVARLFKISDSVIKKAIKNFKPLPHRLEFVGEFKGIKFYDDAISTTPESTIMAIKALKNIGTIFLGGQDRGYDFRELEKILKLYRIQNIVLFPETGNRILKSRKGFNIFETRSINNAVKFAFKNTPKGRICLLSTASPSYSIWKNFEEKGDLFQYFVKNYQKN
mgnify:FL=1